MFQEFLYLWLQQNFDTLTSILKLCAIAIYCQIKLNIINNSFFSFKESIIIMQLTYIIKNIIKKHLSKGG